MEWDIFEKGFLGIFTLLLAFFDSFTKLLIKLIFEYKRVL